MRSIRSSAGIRLALVLVTTGAIACGDDDAPPGAPTFPGAEAGIPPLRVDGSVLDVDVSLAAGPGPGAYLVDSEGQTLYMFANDTRGAQASRCEGACVTDWPIFDRIGPTVGGGLDADDFGRFLRSDSRWQTTYRGQPLYLYSGDSDANPRAGDGLNNRWFAARNYFAFVAAQVGLVPLGDTTGDNDPYLTDGQGRTAYVFESDTPGTAPASACDEACLVTWPIWPAVSDLGNLVLPPGLDLADFGAFERTVGGESMRQLTYRQWPLYFFSEDDQAGETTGHTRPNWSAIDPRTFEPTRAAAGTE